MKSSKLLLAIAACAISVSSFAQVKIGTNPTTIEPTSNLEVEASTNGRKMKVDKTIGQVTIADGTQGAGKVFTSDAVGGGSWQTPLAQNTDVWVYATKSATQTINGNGFITRIDFDTEVYDRGSNFNPAADQVTVPTAGIYRLDCSVKKNNFLGNTTAFNMILTIYVNGVARTVIYEDGWDNGDVQPRATGSLTLQLSAGDAVEIRLTASYNPYTISESYLTFMKLSN